ncbi:MAG TPA: hypothetical protein VEC16_00290 [Alphaproteobacteria bacterium]|nr:hypothetical protein [Alphaproteobacteria bacterium]
MNNQTTNLEMKIRKKEVTQENIAPVVNDADLLYQRFIHLFKHFRENKKKYFDSVNPLFKNNDDSFLEESLVASDPNQLTILSCMYNDFFNYYSENSNVSKNMLKIDINKDLRDLVKINLEYLFNKGHDSFTLGINADLTKEYTSKNHCHFSSWINKESYNMKNINLKYLSLPKYDLVLKNASLIFVNARDNFNARIYQSNAQFEGKPVFSKHNFFDSTVKLKDCINLPTGINSKINIEGDIVISGKYKEDEKPRGCTYNVSNRKSFSTIVRAFQDCQDLSENFIGGYEEELSKNLENCHRSKYEGARIRKFKPNKVNIVHNGKILDSYSLNWWYKWI